MTWSHWIRSRSDCRHSSVVGLWCEQPMRVAAGGPRMGVDLMWAVGGAGGGATVNPESSLRMWRALLRRYCSADGPLGWGGPPAGLLRSACGRLGSRALCHSLLCRAAGCFLIWGAPALTLGAQHMWAHTPFPCRLFHFFLWNFSGQWKV